MHPDDWLAQYDATLQQAQQSADRASSQLAEIDGEASSPDGQVTVRVSTSGGLVDLRLGAGTRNQHPDQLAATILDCARRAQRDAASRVVQVMQELVGDSAALEFVKGNLPHGYAGDGTDATPSRPPRDDDDEDFGNRTWVR